MSTEASGVADHGGNIISISSTTGKDPCDYLDFSSNINEFIEPENLEHSGMARGHGRNKYFRFYPETDYRDIEKKFAEINQVDPDMVTVGAGMTPLIYRSLDTMKATSTIVLYPSFSEYERALKARNLGIIAIPAAVLRQKPEILRSYSYDFLFIANPDNPTGTLTGQSALREIVEVSYEKNATVFVDEAFMDFCGGVQTASSMVCDFPNLIVGRTLTKISGLPGMRIGYTISSKSIADRIKSGMESWSLSQETIEFARRLNMPMLLESLKPLEKEREYMKDKLNELGLDIVGVPSANYIAFRCEKRSRQESLSEFLARKFIIIRDLKKYRGIAENSFRVSIKTREKNDILLDALEEYLSVQ
jgi:threonine-phosphate decarboxylase